MSEQSRREMFELASRMDQLCDEFETQWASGAQPAIEDFLQQVAEPERQTLFRDLLVAELELLGREGQVAAEASYSQRFPEFASVVAEVFIGSGNPAVLGQLREYELQEKLGEGGMGVVYRAMHSRLKRTVAIKTLPPEKMDRPEVVARFHREMEATGQLDDPHIVRAHDAGEVDGTHFLVMEFVDGLDLRQLQERTGPLSVANACEIVRQVALGLQSAADAGLVHRDIKPANLMLTNSGIVKILDLGLAQIATDTDAVDRPELTSTGQIMGTFDFLAPEQATDTKSVDIRADIYALGCTLFKLLTGKAPYAFDGPATPFQRIRAHLEDPLPAVRDVRADVPAALDELLARMLAKQPADRITPPSVVAEQIAEFCGGHDLPALLKSAEGQPAAASDTASVAGQTVPYVSVAASAASLPEAAPESQPAAQGQSTSPSELTAPVTADDDEPAPKRRRILPVVIALAMALSLLAYLSPVIFSVKTDGGTIVLECDPAALQGAKVEIDGEEVQLTLAGDDQPVTIGVDKRRGQLRITKAGFKVFATDFEIAGGESEDAIQVRFVAAESSDELDRKAANWVLGIGGTVDVASPEDVGFSSRYRKVTRTGSLPVAEIRLVGVNVLNNKSVTDAGLANLVMLPALEDLILQGTSISDHGLVHLAGLPNLVSLDLDSTAVTDTGIASLGVLPRLQWFYLSNTQITDEAVAHLVKQPSLHYLEASQTRISGDGLKMLTKLPHLRQLGLLHTSLTEADLKSLAVFKELENLALNRSCVTDRSAELVSNLPRLSVLAFTESSQLTDVGVRHLSKLQGLTNLSLGQTRITDEALASLEALTRLKSLYVGDTEVTVAGIEKLRKALPQCHFIYGPNEQLQTLEPVTNRDREAAEWVVDLGGTATVLTIADRDLPENAQDISGKTPLPAEPFWLGGVNLTGSSRLDDDGLKQLIGLSELITLNLQNTHISDEGLRHLQSVTSLKYLELDNTQVSDTGIAFLGALQDLELLDLNGTRITDAAVETLATLPKLRVFNAGFTSMTGKGLAGLQAVGSLRELNIPHTKISDADLKILDQFTELRILNVSGLSVSDQTLSRIAALEQLEILVVGHTETLTDDGLKQLPKLTNLSLAFDVNIGDQGLMHLEAIPSLRVLDLTQTQVTASGTARLQKGLPELQRLTIGFTKIGDEGLKAIAEWPLENLDLNSAEFTDAGLAHLARMDTLQELILFRTTVSDDGLKHLLTLRNLRSLNLVDTTVTDAGVSTLREALPQCRITYGPGANPVVIEPAAE